MSKYNSWPLGKIPKELQRSEPDKIKELGYKWQDPRDIIDIFEKKVAEFAGSKYAVAVDCCTHALELSLRLKSRQGISSVTIPKHTYISVPMTLKNLGYMIEYADIEWSGIYQLSPFDIYDGAGRWKKDMYVGGLHCLSFQIKKDIPIGRGGIVLTNSDKDYEVLKLMSYDGRDLNSKYDSPKHIQCMGYHYYMTPEDAARGIILMDEIGEKEIDTYNSNMYPDLTQWKENWHV